MCVVWVQNQFQFLFSLLPGLLLLRAKCVCKGIVISATDSLKLNISQVSVAFQPHPLCSTDCFQYWHAAISTGEWNGAG